LFHVKQSQFRPVPPLPAACTGYTPEDYDGDFTNGMALKAGFL